MASAPVKIQTLPQVPQLLTSVFRSTLSQAVPASSKTRPPVLTLPPRLVVSPSPPNPIMKLPALPPALVPGVPAEPPLTPSLQSRKQAACVVQPASALSLSAASAAGTSERRDEARTP